MAGACNHRTACPHIITTQLRSSLDEAEAFVSRMPTDKIGSDGVASRSGADVPAAVRADSRAFGLRVSCKARSAMPVLPSGPRCSNQIKLPESPTVPTKPPARLDIPDDPKVSGHKTEQVISFEATGTNSAIGRCCVRDLLGQVCYHCNMKTVNIGDLKAQLSAHIQLVRNGEEVLVCDRNKPVARIVPIRLEDHSAQEQRLVARGLLTPTRPTGFRSSNLGLPNNASR